MQICTWIPPEEGLRIGSTLISKRTLALGWGDLQSEHKNKVPPIFSNSVPSFIIDQGGLVSDYVCQVLTALLTSLTVFCTCSVV